MTDQELPPGPTPGETPRERFIRNAQENDRAIRARALAFERAGDHETAARIRVMADDWNRITEHAKSSTD